MEQIRSRKGRDSNRKTKSYYRLLNTLTYSYLGRSGGPFIKHGYRKKRDGYSQLANY